MNALGMFALVVAGVLAATVILVILGMLLEWQYERDKARGRIPR